MLRNFTLDPRDPKRLTADVPAGFEEVAANELLAPLRAC